MVTLTTNNISFICFIPRAQTLLLCALVMILSGCSTSKYPNLTKLPDNISNKHIIYDVPIIEQKNNYCGPASITMIGQFQGLKIDQDKASKMVYTPGRDGTFQHDMLTALIRLGLVTVPIKNIEEIIQALDKNQPVLVFQNLGLSWYPVWHYSVVVGYDLENRLLLLHTGEDERKWKSFKVFSSVWNRAGKWAYVGHHSDVYLNFIDENDYVESATKLEKFGHINDARRVYLNVLKRNDKNINALFGLGNIAMSENNYQLAEIYYTKILSNSKNIYAANNLAYSLDKQSKKKKACSFLKNAILTYEDKKMLKESYGEICG